MKRLSILLLTYLVIAIYCGAGEIDPKTIYDKLDMKIYRDQGIDAGQMHEFRRREFRSSEIFISTSALHRVLMGSSNTTDSLSTNISLKDDAIFETPQLSLRSIASSNRISNTFTNSPKSAD